MGSVQARAMCCSGIGQLLTLILTLNPDLLLPLVATLEGGLPGRGDTEHSSLLQTYHGLGLGCVLARLFREQYVDGAGTEVGGHERFRIFYLTNRGYIA